MPEKKHLNVLWTNEALRNASSIKEYLKVNFSEKEIQVFYSLLSSFEKAVSFFPQLYPQTNKKGKIRRAVLSREISAFYRISNDQIEVLAILDNRCDLSEWLQLK
jgi:plasmid stabilization system protein ParE